MPAESVFARRVMSRYTVAIILVLLVAILGGAVFLVTWDIPAPSAPVEKTLSNDRFPD